jgi:hypothetical protein
MRINSSITILAAAIAVVAHSTNLLCPTLTRCPFAPSLIFRGSSLPSDIGAGRRLSPTSIGNDECLDVFGCGSAR